MSFRSRLVCALFLCSSTSPLLATDCNTTPIGPPRANLVMIANTPGASPLTSPNMLWCPGGKPYALCFFSGPPYKTGVNCQDQNCQNNVLPCALDKNSGVANCTCQVYSSSSYYVDVNSILNEAAMAETQRVCGTNGACCKNIRDCDQNGQGANCPATVAPVCNLIANQGGTSGEKFYPDAELVSTFSYAMGTATSGSYHLGSTPCSGLYAGCMTAPCKYQKGQPSSPTPPDGTMVQCACPTWNGAYEVGQNSQSCELGSSNGEIYVWSAAHSIVTTESLACQATASEVNKK
jgi:hypothetical protein